MTPTNFPESNTRLGPPKGTDESQVGTLPACIREQRGGNMDGTQLCTVAWLPSEEERAAIAAGAPIYLTSCGILPPHFLSVQFIHNLPA